MKFEQLHSSSKGNLYLLTANNGNRLLIECGVTWAKIQAALSHDIKGIVGCLVTHAHKDHCKAIREVMKAGIDVYASWDTFRVLGIKDNERRSKIDTGELMRLGFQVRTYPTVHDAKGSEYFIIQCDKQILLFATDTCFIREDLSHIPFNIVAIECSYD